MTMLGFEMPSAGLAPHLAQRPTLASSDRFSVVLASSLEDVRIAQALRHQVFVGGSPMTTTGPIASGVDADPYDADCDHLLLIQNGPGAEPEVVGACRVLHENDRGPLGFYSQQEFEFTGMFRANPGLAGMELGRVCILPAYRTGRAVELMWRGVWAYARSRRVGLLFGCASLPGCDPAAHVEHLAYMQHFAAAPAEWNISAQQSCSASVDAPMPAPENRFRIFSTLPPLLKTYLRLGARIGNGAVADPAFNTLDVFVALRMGDVKPRYSDYFNG